MDVAIVAVGVFTGGSGDVAIGAAEASGEAATTDVAGEATTTDVAERQTGTRGQQTLRDMLMEHQQPPENDRFVARRFSRSEIDRQAAARDEQLLTPEQGVLRNHPPEMPRDAGEDQNFQDWRRNRELNARADGDEQFRAIQVLLRREPLNADQMFRLIR